MNRASVAAFPVRRRTGTAKPQAVSPPPVSPNRGGFDPIAVGLAPENLPRRGKIYRDVYPDGVELQTAGPEDPPLCAF